MHRYWLVVVYGTSNTRVAAAGRSLTWKNIRNACLLYVPLIATTNDIQLNPATVESRYNGPASNGNPLKTETIV